MKLRYRLHPGTITREADGEAHYIDAPSLAHLYGVDMQECVVALPPRAFDRASWRRDPHEDLIQLRPRADGDYSKQPVSAG